MEKCMICGKNFDAHVCPVCGNGRIEILSDNRDVIPDEIRPILASRRERFLDRVSFSMRCYWWNESNDGYVLGKQELVPVGTANDLYRRFCWGNTIFDTLSDKDGENAEICVSVGDIDYILNIEIPNKTDSDCAVLGACLGEDMSFILAVKYSDGTELRSDPCQIFDLMKKVE